MQFDLILRNEKIKSYRVITLLIVIMNILYFSYLLFEKESRKTGLISLGTLAAYGIYKFLMTKKKHVPFRIDEWVFFVLMLLWIDSYPLAILNLLFMLMYTAATQQIRYEFTEAVAQKNFPWKKYEWGQFSNIILKDNILTMDFVTNKIIQGEVENEVDQKAFNTFALSKLSSKTL